MVEAEGHERRQLLYTVFGGTHHPKPLDEILIQHTRYARPEIGHDASRCTGGPSALMIGACPPGS